jgi:hypothetical protein
MVSGAAKLAVIDRKSRALIGGFVTGSLSAFASAEGITVGGRPRRAIAGGGAGLGAVTEQPVVATAAKGLTLGATALHGLRAKAPAKPRHANGLQAHAVVFSIEVLAINLLAAGQAVILTALADPGAIAVGGAGNQRRRAQACLSALGVVGAGGARRSPAEAGQGAGWRRARHAAGQVEVAGFVAVANDAIVAKTVVLEVVAAPRLS